MSLLTELELLTNLEVKGTKRSVIYTLTTDPVYLHKLFFFRREGGRNTKRVEET